MQGVDAAGLGTFTPPERFRLLRKLGEGGSGVVFEALDQEHRTRIALKYLRLADAASVMRFKREFRALQGLHHAHLVGFGQLFCHEGQWFFTMDLVEGVDLLTYVRGLLDATQPAFAVYESGTTRAAGDEAWDQTERFSRNSHGRIAVAGSMPDERRLRACLAQLASAIAALEAAGLVHRDIKPSNVRVTGEGRLVLLDFGLVSSSTRAHESTEAHIVGTAAYMAPEQAASKPVGSAADWYALGAVLYEALTGRVPFEGNPIEVLVAKQFNEPPPPSSLARAVPPDLDRLCLDLLRADPEQRVAGIRAARKLAESVAPFAAPVPAPPSTSVDGPPFVGREAELHALEAALADAGRSEAVVVFVEGESGVGKSALVRRFLELALGARPDLVVLSGRCREHESVPYKAFDGIVDGLSRFMAKLPKAESAALVPLRGALLADVFPVLKRVEAIATAPRLRGDELDPIERRGRVFGALRELFLRLSARSPVVLFVDDLQWADPDSLALLEEVTRPPEAPPILLLASVRTSDVASARQLLAAERLGHVRHVAVPRLTPDEAHDLAARLARRVGLAAAIDLGGMADEAAGHPMFLDELIRHAATFGGTAPTLRLDDALWARVSTLDPRAREALFAVVLAGRPITLDTMAQCAGLEMAHATRILAALRVSNLVRTSAGRRLDRVEPFHDRVREAIAAHLTPDERRRIHQRLALTLEAQGGDAEALAHHWLEAGDVERASSYAEKAADQTAEALAFAQAARLYRLAIDVAPARAGSAHLWRRLGDALANAGRGAESAEALRRAAEHVDDAQALALRQKAAEQLLRAGRIDEGLAAVRSVLASVGLRLPPSPFAAFVSFLLTRLFLKVRGFSFQERDTSQLTPARLAVVDVCWSLSFTLSIVDTIRGSDFQARHMRRALELGEPYRMARALAMEVGYAVGVAGERWERAERLYKRALALAERSNNPHAVACAHMTAGVATYLSGHFRLAHELSDRAETALRACVGAWSEVDRSRTFTLSALAMLGRTKELARRQPQYLREAEERGDRYSATNLRVGHPNLVWLVMDDPEGARRAACDAMAEWSKQGFHLEHYYGLLALVQTDLYEGRAREAWARIAEAWTALRRALLLRVHAVHQQAFYLRGRAAVALAEADAAARPALLAEARRAARRIRRQKRAWSEPLAGILEAGCLAVDGETAAARQGLAEAAAQADQSDMALHAVSARYWLGRLEGTKGEETVRAAEDALRDEGIRRPEAIAFMIAPGFRHATGSQREPEAQCGSQREPEAQCGSQREPEAQPGPLS